MKDFDLVTSESGQHWMNTKIDILFKECGKDAELFDGFVPEKEVPAERAKRSYPARRLSSGNRPTKC